jgi:hypothetical protein
VVRNIIRIIASSIVASLLLIQSAFALTQVTATIDKNPVMDKESFVLQVIADDDIESNALDTSPLLKDFIVGRTSVSTQTSMVNFDTTRTTKWTTVLIARSPGKYTIPALTVESVSTQPIAVEVLEASSQGAAKTQDIFITTDISAKEVYVQQQLTLTVKLHFAAELKRGSLSEPTLDGASINQVGKDIENDSIINGRRYRVVERNYAINPQNSGEFIIKTPLFSGEIISPSSRRSQFLSFTDTKPVSVLGEDINLLVKPIPDNYQGVWLPSEILNLDQEWQPAGESFMVGEPITRTLTLTAAGLSEEQLPKLEMTSPSGIKIYPDQAELHTGMSNGRLISQKKQNFALVASRVGTYKLPEIRLPWWNTVTNRVQYAVIPDKNITITPNDEMVEELKNSGNNSGSNNINNTTDGLTTQNNNALTSDIKTVVVTKSSWLQWLFLALWLLTSLAWLLSILSKRKPQVTEAKATSNSHYKALIKACDNNTGEEVLKLIVIWANECFSNDKISTLDDAKHVINHSDFNNALTDLQACFYGKNTQPWQGQTLKNLIIEINRQPKSANKETVKLNP